MHEAMLLLLLLRGHISRVVTVMHNDKHFSRFQPVGEIRLLLIAKRNSLNTVMESDGFITNYFSSA